MSQNTRLTQAEELKTRGCYDQALEMVKEIEEDEKTSSIDQIRCKILKSSLIFLLGQFKEALNLANQAYSESQDLKAPLQVVDSLIVMSIALTSLGKYEESLNKILEAQNVLKTLDKVDLIEIRTREATLLYHRSTTHRRKGELDQALEDAKDSLIRRQSLGIKKDISQSLHGISSIYTVKGKFDEALKYGKESLALQKELNNKLRISICLDSIGIIYWFKGDFDHALECTEQALKLREELNDKEGIAKCLNNISNIYADKGELDIALNYLKKAITIHKEVNDKFSLALTIGNLGILYREKGDYDQALKILKESLELRQELGNKVHIGTCLNSIGSVFGDKGELNQALKYFEQSIAIWEELDNKNRLATALNNIASVYRQKGNLDQALESLERSLKLRKKLNNIKDIARSLYNVGLVYWFKGDLSKALVYLEQALVLNEEIQNDIKTSDTLFYLVSVALDNNNLKITQKHLDSLQAINTRRKDKIINQRLQLAEALVLKASPSIQDRVKAKTILRRLIEEEVGEHSLIVLALLNLCDISLGELETTPSQKGLVEEVQNFVEKIHVIAQQQTSHWLLSAAYILKTRISFLDLRYQWSFAKAEELKTTLQQVQQIAQEKQLFVLLAQVHLLLAFFYHSKLIFDEAKSEVEKAQEIINDKNLLKEEQKLNTISQQIQASEAAYSQYLGVLAETFEQGEHKQSLSALEQEFISSVDDYLKMLKASLVTLDAD